MGPIRRQASPLTRNSVLQMRPDKGRVTHENDDQQNYNYPSANHEITWQIGGKAPLIPNVGTSWSVVTSRPSRNPATNSIRGCLAPTFGMEVFEKKNISHPDRNRTKITRLSNTQLSHTKDYVTPGPVKRKKEKQIKFYYLMVVPTEIYGARTWEYQRLK